jgi:predicted ferric reductase
VELLLNLVWMAVSLFLIGGWIWSIRKGYIEFEWAALVALVLLIVILFPAISMTDDLMAMNMPIEVEHAMRRSEAPLAPVAVLGLLGILAAMVLVLLNMAAPRLFSRIRPRVFAATLLAGFIRAFGVRPPPAFAFSV